jgi:hypothetical protein
MSEYRKAMRAGQSGGTAANDGNFSSRCGCAFEKAQALLEYRVG